MDTDDATGRGSRAAAPDAVGPIRVDAEPLHYEPALDGIRAVAVLAVMAFHFLGAEYFAGGLIGVDVFFVLSGFLITSLLLDEQNRTGAVSLRGFYHRRVLRLFPAMYTLLGLVAVAAIFIGPSTRRCGPSSGPRPCTRTRSSWACSDSPRRTPPGCCSTCGPCRSRSGSTSSGRSCCSSGCAHVPASGR
ncbi:MAG: acyltransferase [Microthrixaceae bacterium]|nr:acyltransferase [Microthrixaceae bacterium]